MALQFSILYTTFPAESIIYALNLISVSLCRKAGVGGEAGAEPGGGKDFNGGAVGTEFHDEVECRADVEREGVGRALNLFLRVVERQGANIVGLAVGDADYDALRGFVGHHPHGVGKHSVDVKPLGKFECLLCGHELADAVEGVAEHPAVLSFADEIPAVETLLDGIGADAECGGDVVGVEAGIGHEEHVARLHGFDRRYEFRASGGGMFGDDASGEGPALVDHIGEAEGVEEPCLQASVAVVAGYVVDVTPGGVTLKRYAEELAYALAIAVEGSAREGRAVVERGVCPLPADFAESEPPVKARNSVHKPNISLYDG